MTSYRPRPSCGLWFLTPMNQGAICLAGLDKTTVCNYVECMVNTSPKIAATMMRNVLSYVGLLSAEMPVSVLGTFLGVVIWGGGGTSASPQRTIAELADRLSLPESTVYQHVRYLGTAPHRYGKPGLGLVETTTNPANRRQKFVGLTPAGLALIERIAEVLKPQA
jgi:hypothetical protein